MMRRKILKLNIRSVIAVLLATVFILTAVPVVSAADIGGDCGKGMKWSLAGGTLTISGKGAMKNYQEFAEIAPWQEYSEEIFAIKVSKGVTHIGDFAFFRLDRVISATLADSVKTIGKLSFYECSKLSMIELGNGLEEIGYSAFELCESLTAIRLPSSLKTIRSEAFYRCSSLSSVTVPESVTLLESQVFTYCTSLRTAKILAKIKELPYWTFYGCHGLVSVSLSETIKDVGVQAFDNCESLTTVTTGTSGSDANKIFDKLPYTVTDFNTSTPPTTDSSGDFISTGKDENGNTVNVSGSFVENENGSVSSEVTHIKGENLFTSDVTVNATIEKPEGWNDLKEELADAMADREYGANKNTVNVTVNLKGDPEINGEDLGIFSGKDVNVTIHTSQGATFEFVGSNVSVKELSDKYDLSYTLTFIDDPSKKQKEVIGLSGYMLVFNGNIDFKFEIHLPLGKELARDKAVFFSPERDGGYTRMQASIIDAEGIAHFYLAKVSKKAEYLIGINVVDHSAAPEAPSDAIVPDELAGDYPHMDYNPPVEYVITDVKSSWGMSFNQVTWILFGGMGVLIIVVGIIVYIMFKSKQRNGMYYDPVLDGDDKKNKEKNTTSKKENAKKTELPKIKKDKKK